MTSLKQKHNRVWVIGAGASAADTDGECPMDNDFFIKLAEKFVEQKEYFAELTEFLDKVYNYDLWNKRCLTPRLEEVFTKLDISLRWMQDLKSEQETETHRRTWPLIHKDCVDHIYLPIFRYYENELKYFGNDFTTELKLKLEKCYKLLKYAMVAIFLKVSEKEPDNKNYSLHQDLIKKVNGEKEIIITTNYDLILDKCLKKLKPEIGYYQIFWNEFQEFTEKGQKENWSDEKIKEEYRKKYLEKENQIFLLKLHGSINWKYDPTATSKDANHFIRLADEEIKGNLNYERSQCIAITPLVVDKQATFKPTSKFGRVWTKAFIELLKADEIIFIGYSFPQSDFLAKDLFRSSYVKRMQSEGSKKLKVSFSTKTKKENQKDENCDAHKVRMALGEIYQMAEIDYLGDFEQAIDGI